MTPNPSINIDFFKTPNFVDPRITFTRSSNGYYMDKNGTITNAQTDQPRFEYAANGMLLGLLNEEQRVNYILQSENFSTTWTATDITVSNNVAIAPNVTTTADLLIEGTANTALMTQSVTVATANLAAGSVYLKAGPNNGVTWVKVFVAGAGAANGAAAWFNLSTGALGSNAVIGSGTTPIAAIEPHIEGWYRCRISANCPGETGISLSFHSASADGSNTRVANSTYWAWGGQLENARTGTSYIPTTTATATRANELMVIGGGAFTSVYNTTTYEGTILASFLLPNNASQDDNQREILGVSIDGTNASFKRGSLYYNSTNASNYWTYLGSGTSIGSSVAAGNNVTALSYSGPKGTFSYRNGTLSSGSGTNFFRNAAANTANVSAATDTILMTSANSFVMAGDRLFYTVPTGNTPIAGLSGNAYYYVTFANSSAFALSTTSGGANIDLTEARTTNPGETHTFNQSVLPAVDRIHLGALWNTQTNYGLNGHFKRFAYFPTALSNTQLQYITSI